MISERESVSQRPGGETAHQAFQELAARYGELLFRVAYAVVHDRGLAEDVVQDTLLKAWTTMPSWEGDAPVKWMRRVARNQAIDVMRHRSRLASTEPTESPDSRASVEREVEGRELLEAMSGALATLDEESRLLIVLRETDGLSYEEIADLLDTTTSAVKAKLYRARHHLRSELRDWSL